MAPPARKLVDDRGAERAGAAGDDDVAIAEIHDRSRLRCSEIRAAAVDFPIAVARRLGTARPADLARRRGRWRLRRGFRSGRRRVRVLPCALIWRRRLRFAKRSMRAYRPAMDRRHRPLPALRQTASTLCVCDEIVPIDNRVAVLILQHPQEQDRELGTAQPRRAPFEACDADGSGCPGRASPRRSGAPPIRDAGPCSISARARGAAAADRRQELRRKRRAI